MRKFSLGSRKSQLLTCTAFTAFVAGGVVLPMSVQQAAAACLPGANSLVCTDTTNTAQNFTATADGFGVAIGVDDPLITGTNTNTVTVNAVTYDGVIRVAPGSQILVPSGGGGLRHGLVVNAGNNAAGGVDINIDGIVRSNDTDSGIGFADGADSMRLNGTGQSIFNVNITADGEVGGGTGRNGINVTQAGSVNITNAGSIAAGTASTTAFFVPLGQLGNAIKVGDSVLGAISGTAVINNTGEITGLGGALSPVIYSRAAGGTTINNNEGGRIGDATGSGGDGDLVIASTGSGGQFVINNYGTINGRMDFSLTSGAGVIFNNYSNNSWNTSGITNYSNDADLVNNEGGTLTTTGAANINFLDGDDQLINQANGLGDVGTIDLDAVTVFTFGQGGDLVNNTEGSIIDATGAGSTTWLFDNELLGVEFGPQGADTFRNENYAQYTGSGLTTFFFGGEDDSFVNQSYASFSVDGVNVLDFGTGDDDFLNDSAGFYADGVSTNFLFAAGDDAMVNDNYGDISIDSLVNTFDFGAGEDSFRNGYNSWVRLGTNNLLGSANLFDFGADDDTFVNEDGAYFQADGVNDIDNLETLTNTNGAWLEFNGLNEIGDTNTTGLNALENTDGATFELEGVSFVNFNGNANTFDNTYGNFVSRGATIVDFGGDDDTFDNDGGWVYATGSFLGGIFEPIGVLTFANLETFHAGYGATDMMDGDVLDTILMPGATYVMDGDADHFIDVSLGGILTLGGDYMAVGAVDGSGTTYVHVNDVDPGPGEYNPLGFAIVGVEDGSGELGDFVLADGPIEKGLFSYDIYLDDPGLHPKCIASGASDCFVIASVLGQRAYELPVLAYAAQQMWHTSTGVWTDRTADLRSAFGGTGFGGGGADAIVEPVEPMAAVGNVTPGIWGRVFGATQSRDLSNSSAPPLGLEGFDTEFNNNFKQNIYGAMAGIDFGKESLSEQGNQAWIFGLFGGYTGSNLEFDDSDTDVDYTAGSVGAYITYLNGGLFIDTTIKADFGKMDYSSGGESASADFTSVGGVVDAGYRFTQASGWYFEPKATLAYVHTDFDNIETFGTDIEFDDGESLRGRLGGRVGTTLDRNGIVIEPYLEASVWNEFSGDYTASFVSNGFNLDPAFDAEGVYGEVALGSSFINAANGWSGFAKGAVQFGEDSALGVTGNLGVRKAW